LSDLTPWLSLHDRERGLPKEGNNMPTVEKLPTENEILASVAEVFDLVRGTYPHKLLSALITVDKTMHRGLNIINYVVDYEMQELCDFANGFIASLKHTEDHLQQIRTKILVYCHIMEADLPTTIFWNLLRILNNERPDWTFHGITSGGETQVCQYPREKIAELKRLSEISNVSIGGVLDRLWKGELRNAFSHSAYFLMGNMLTATGSLSPLSRKDRSDKRNPSFSFDHIEGLYEGATKLLYFFTNCYSYAIEPFRDGNARQIDDGSVVWDAPLGRWLWEQNAPRNP
jgi:hypothetical protein